LNYRLHRRVELLVLVSSSFRVSSSVHISHAAAASLSHPLSTIPSTNFHHVLRTVYCHNHSWGHSHLRLIESASYLVCLGKREKKKIKKKKREKRKEKKRKRGRRKRKKAWEKKERRKKNWIYLESISYLNSDWNLFCALFSKTGVSSSYEVRFGSVSTQIEDSDEPHLNSCRS